MVTDVKTSILIAHNRSMQLRYGNISNNIAKQTDSTTDATALRQQLCILKKVANNRIIFKVCAISRERLKKLEICI